ncbi:unnamed protein product [Symbiodinium natans]|uniref:Uncharacterized protein n=1 Tax=Symbiodinium natans TaxID=878477 RepID=A0A812RWC0_9DINO|nr:unnamed protein product [Symbiodinium natans]
MLTTSGQNDTVTTLSPVDSYSARPGGASFLRRDLELSQVSRSRHGRPFDLPEPSGFGAVTWGDLLRLRHGPHSVRREALDRDYGVQRSPESTTCIFCCSSARLLASRRTASFWRAAQRELASPLPRGTCAYKKFHFAVPIAVMPATSAHGAFEKPAGMSLLERLRG